MAMVLAFGYSPCWTKKVVLVLHVLAICLILTGLGRDSATHHLRDQRYSISGVLRPDRKCIVLAKRTRAHIYIGLDRECRSAHLRGRLSKVNGFLILRSPCWKVVIRVLLHHQKPHALVVKVDRADFLTLALCDRLISPQAHVLFVKFSPMAV